MATKFAMTGLILALAVTAAALAEPGGTTASLQSGHLHGVAQEGTVAFLGIPYAAPPVGARRWQPPAPALHWKGVREATAFGASCPQMLNPPGGRLPWTPEYLIPGPMSEDCLTLNVWRPAGAAMKLPVLFWIHGGGGIEGSTSVPIYDGAAFARQGIVVISINYRLGVLASLTHPALTREQGGTSGNYGLQDILAALRWTRANVAAFGGDPARITVAGQSAGAGYVTQLVSAPAGHGLFARAITESGSQWGTRPASPPLAQGEAQGVAFATAVGAPSLAALRAMPAEQLVREAATRPRTGTVVDGRWITVDPGRAQAAPGFNDTPILSGFNAEEESGSDALYGQWTVAELNKKRTTQFGSAAAQAAVLYPAATDEAAHRAGQDMARERSRMAMYEWARRRAVISRYPVYVYFFDHPHPGPQQVRYGTFHSSEIPYVFGNLSQSRPFGDADRALTRTMQARWVSYIKGGAPDAAGAPPWPVFTAASPMMIKLGDNPAAMPVLPADKLKFADDTLGRAGEQGTATP